VVLGRGVGGLVVVGDHRYEVAGLLVLDDAVELSAPEVSKEDSVVLVVGNRCNRLVVELFLEGYLVVDAGPRERRRGDGGTGQAVGVNV
jgi:hypothetical protein